MKKAIYLMLMGLLPMALGALVNVIVTSVQMPVFLISLAALFVWYFMSHKMCYSMADFYALNAPATIFIILIAVQELVLHSYIGGVGVMCQMFFLPFLSVGATLLGGLGNMFAIYFGSYAVMLLCSFIGARQKVKGK